MRPRARGGKPEAWYDLDAVRAWLDKEGRTGRRGRPRPNGTGRLLDINLTDDEIRKKHALESLRKLTEQADKLALANAERRRRLVDVEEFRELVDVMAGTLRRAGEQLQRLHGVEPARVLEEALDEVERKVRRKGAG